MQAKHTPGPWQATANETYGHYGPSWSIRIATGTAQDRRIVIAGINGAALHGGAENAAANARLIAAAPELLETLGYCESWFAKHSPTAELINNLGHAEHPMLTCIRAAIAKATGN